MRRPLRRGAGRCVVRFRIDDTHRGTANETTLGQRGGGLVTHQHAGTGVGGQVAKVLIEQLSTQDHAVRGKRRVIGPWRLDSMTTRDHRNTVDTVTTERQRIDLEVRQFGEGPR